MGTILEILGAVAFIGIVWFVFEAYVQFWQGKRK